MYRNIFTDFMIFENIFFYAILVTNSYVHKSSPLHNSVFNKKNYKCFDISKYFHGQGLFLENLTTLNSYWSWHYDFLKLNQKMGKIKPPWLSEMDSLVLIYELFFFYPRPTCKTNRNP